MKINCVLSGASFRQAAKDVRAYRQLLEESIATFVELVAQAGYDVIEAILEQHVETGATIGSLAVRYSKRSGTYKAKVVVASDAILFLEFGSGLQGLDGAQNPAAAEMPFPVGAGTYPSTAPPQHESLANWEIPPPGWHYIDDSGHMRWSTGMPAAMPMYQGGQAMEQQLMSIAKKVFGDD